MSTTLAQENSTGDPVSSSSSSRNEHRSKHLPSYTSELADFHRAFVRELTSLIDLLPVCRGGRILDAACGDGFYLSLLARELEPQILVGLDANAACLELAGHATAGIAYPPVALVNGTLENFPREPEFDLVWCAQSLFSLPDPLQALRQMTNLVRPGGTVAILENDTLHQALLPLPSHLELAVRSLEHDVLAAKSNQPEQYYVGRRLPALLSEAGLASIGFRTQSIDRMAPLDLPLERFLESYLRRLFGRVSKGLPSDELQELREWILPTGSSYLLRQPNFSMSWFNVLAWGRRPFGPIRSGTASSGPIPPDSSDPSQGSQSSPDGIPP